MGRRSLHLIVGMLFLGARALAGSPSVAQCLSDSVAIARSALTQVDVEKEYFAEAYTEKNGDRFYYGMRLSKFDKSMRSENYSEVKLPFGKNLTGRDYPTYLKRLGISEEQVLDSRGQSWLSVGEGTSNFTQQIERRGIRGVSVDAAQINPYAPHSSVLAYAQNLPFADETFDRTNSVWLVQHFFRPSAGSSMFNPAAGRKAILEMIRVTKQGGEIRINPILDDGPPILDFLQHLKELGLIDFHTRPETKLLVRDGRKILENSGQDTTVIIQRKGGSSSEEHGLMQVPRESRRSEVLVRYGFFSKESMEVKEGERILEFGDDPSWIDELKGRKIDARLYDFKKDGEGFLTGAPDQSIDRVFNLSGGVESWDSGSIDPMITEISRVMKPGARAYFSSISWRALSEALSKHPELEIVRREERSRTGKVYVEIRKRAPQDDRP